MNGPLMKSTKHVQTAACNSTKERTRIKHFATVKINTYPSQWKNKVDINAAIIYYNIVQY